MLKTSAEIQDLVKRKINGNRPNVDARDAENLQAAMFLQMEVLCQIRDLLLINLRRTDQDEYEHFIANDVNSVSDDLTSLKLLLTPDPTA